MPSPFSNGLQNADRAFAALANAKVIMGAASATTAQATATVAHGLGAAPDFVLVQGSVAVGAGAAAGRIGWSATATTLTITRADTAAPETLSYLAGILDS